MEFVETKAPKSRKEDFGIRNGKKYSSRSIKANHKSRVDVGQSTSNMAPESAMEQFSQADETLHRNAISILGVKEVDSFDSNPVCGVDTMTRIGGFAVSSKGELMSDITGPPALRQPKALPAVIKRLTRKVVDIAYDYVAYAQSASDLPLECVLSKRSCMRKLIGMFLDTKADPFEIIVRRQDKRLIFDRKLRSPSPDYYGRSFEMLMTSSPHRQLKSFHTVMLHPNFALSLPLVVCSETDSRDENGADVELKSKAKKKDKKQGGFLPLDRSFIQRSPSWKPILRDYWGQMYFANTRELILGVHEDGNVVDLQRWTIDEVQAEAFGAVDPLIYVGKVSAVVTWISSEFPPTDCVGSLVYDGQVLRLEIAMQTESIQDLTAKITDMKIN